MTDQQSPQEDIQYFKKRDKIYPKSVKGRYRKLKWIVMYTLLAIYYLAPFLRWDRGPYAPDQAILIDMPGRRAYFFFIEIWPQEVYYLTGILIFAAVMLFFVTSLFGRVWCGYACPQTVWTDLFVKVERFFQGDRNARIKFEKSPWGFNKIWRKLATYLSWVLIGAATGGAFVLYFNDAPTVIRQAINLELPVTVWGWVAALTASTYVMAGLAREQVCIYMCPYARFQSAMFDDETLIIGYDEHRGEKRGSHKKGESWDGRGHCVDCNQCVAVCPQGIDIREGLQLECIACGLCVDACNSVMERVGLPRGLIRYDSHANFLKEKDAPRTPFHLLRLRTIYYFAILCAVGVVIFYHLLTRPEVGLNILHDRNPLFVQMSDGDIRNGYTVKVLNRTYEDKHYRLEVRGLDGADFYVKQGDAKGVGDLKVHANSLGKFRVFIKAPRDEADKRKEFEFVITDITTGESDSHETLFVSAN